MSDKLPAISRPTKMSTAVCVSTFEELEAALLFLHAGREDLNPIQQELADRFSSECKSFARNMLVAEGNVLALRQLLGLKTCVKADKAE